MTSQIKNQISKKRKFVADGLFYAELNEFLNRELENDAYAGVEVRVTPSRTEIIIRATRTRAVLGEKAQRIRELTSVVQKRFRFPEVCICGVRSSSPVSPMFFSSTHLHTHTHTHTHQEVSSFLGICVLVCRPS
jgi:KH domain